MFYDVPQFIDQGTCLKCEGCCRFFEQDSLWRPKLNEVEDDYLDKKYGRSPFVGRIDESRSIVSVPIDKVEKEFDLTEGSVASYKCSFLHQGDNLCLVYNFRPLECQLYPFILLKSEDTIQVNVHLSCPYAQENLGDSTFEENINKLKDYLSSGEIVKFLFSEYFLTGDYSGCGDELKELFVIKNKIKND